MEKRFHMVEIQIYGRPHRYAQDLQFNLMSIVTVSLLLMGCSSAYYGTMEKLGYHKRDLMVSRVESARDAQQEAKEEFKSALEKFSSVLQVDGGELEEKYDQLKTAYDKSNARAEAVRDRIEAVEDVSEALFEEWQSELDQYTNDNLRRSSARKLKQTRRQYAQWKPPLRRPMHLSMPWPKNEKMS